VLKVIARPRNSGKTTILLHFMILVDDSVYVARTCEQARKAFEMSERLGCNLDASRFVSMTDPLLENDHYQFLIDNFDCIVKRQGSAAYRLLDVASVITLTQQKEKSKLLDG